MPKSLTANQIAALAASHHVEAYFIEADLPGTVLRYTTAGADMAWNSQTWLGGIDPSWISEIRETESGETVGLRITLSGVSSSQRSAALALNIRGRRLSIWMAPMSTTTYQLLDTPVLEWEGQLDTMYPEDREDGTLAIIVEAENEDARFLRANTRRYTDRDHQQRFPGDTICRFTSQTERTIVWPTKALLTR